MIDKKRKILALFVGCVVSLILLECSLRLLGFVHRSSTRRPVPKVKGSYVILCIGDSLTAGIGAASDKNYPRQLGTLFSQEQSPPVVVVNRGLGGMNSSMVLREIDRHLKEVDPDMVVLLAGVSNFWNPTGYRHYMHRDDLMARMKELLYEIKTFKLFVLLCRGIKKPFFMKGEARKIFDEGQFCEWTGQDAQARELYYRLLKDYGPTSTVYQSLGRLYAKNGYHAAAKEFYMKAIEYNPSRVTHFADFAMRYDRGIREKKDEWRFIKQYEYLNPVVGDIIDKLSDEGFFRRQVTRWVRHDLNEMISRLKKRGVTVILLNYPDSGTNNQVAAVNKVLASVAIDNAVTFVDNRAVFESLLLPGISLFRYFAPDKVHCNDSGYKIMAENVHRCITEKKLIRKRDR